MLTQFSIILRNVNEIKEKYKDQLENTVFERRRVAEKKGSVQKRAKKSRKKAERGEQTELEEALEEDQRKRKQKKVSDL